MLAAMPALVVIVDDDAAVCWALERALTRAGHRVTACATADDALSRIAQQPPALVLTDQRMPGGSGLDLLAALRRDHPHLPVVLMTAYGSIGTAAQAVEAGAYDYLPKPLDLVRTLAVVERALGRSQIAIEVAPSRQDGPVLVGTSPVMQEVVRRLALAGASDLPVLITGPTGSGKELAARLVHRHSRRAGRPLVSVASGLLAGEAGRTELLGLLAAAAGGTLLLDEVADLPAALQAAILGILDGGEPRHDVRIIAISNRDPACPSLRSDLLHRLAVMTVRMPALSERREDLPTLIGHLLGRIAAQSGRRLAMTDAALTALQQRAWPGNVREVRHVLDEAAALAPGGTIDAEHVRDAGAPAPPEAPLLQAADRMLDEHPGCAHDAWIERQERPLLEAAITRTRGNVLRAAELLGLHRTTLRKRLDQLGLGTTEG